ncbi:MAG TPA: GGDEF domain-containing protein, partial [Holophagaceae bacterium]|nr:GGDEF domain-containing protein [Holophagaceae bacterium]
PYTEQDQDLLQFVSTQAAAAIERTRLFGRLSHLATHDPLTGLANRATLEDRLQSALARARRDGSGFGLVFLDIDGFKAVNDRLGHAAGDELLKLIANRLRQSVRESDLVARLGGDEFVVLLERIQQPDHAGPVVEKLRRALAAPSGLEGQTGPVTASLGIALYPRDAADEKELMRKADEAMYAAKQAGGDRAQAAWGR